MSSPPVLVVAGTASGVGKTSVATGLIAALRAAGHVVQGTKVGPDYIDPSYHALASGRPPRNLDAHLSGTELLLPLLHHGSAGADVTIVEGVMGLFDGAQPEDDFASTAFVAKLLGAPVLLVVDVGAMARSAAAIVHGYATFDRDLRIAGVVLNQVGSQGHADLLRTALAPLGIPVVGALPRTDDLSSPSRHLGLVPVAEQAAEARRTVTALGGWIAAHLDLQSVMALARTAAVPAARPWSPSVPGTAVGRRVGVAIAHGPAFSFRYTENLEVMAAAGADLLPFDPIVDARLPSGTEALYLGGGFPEVHAGALAANQPMRDAVAAHVAAGRPVVAECGGLLYLIRELDGTPQVGVLDATGRMHDGLTMGYRTATAASDSVLWRQGEVVRGHEFHQTRTDPVAGPTPAWTIDDRPEGFVDGAVHASYLHTHWAATPHAGARLVAAASAIPHPTRPDATPRQGTLVRPRPAPPGLSQPPTPAARATPAPARVVPHHPLPSLAVTGVGSLPFTDPARAVAFVAANAPRLPFWPQLPQRHAREGMLRQALGDPGDLIRDFGTGLRVARGRTSDLIDWLDDAPVEIGQAEAAGFDALLRALRRGELPRAEAIKGQLTGPLTLGAWLQVDGRPAADHPDLAAAVLRRVTARAAWQTRRLAEHGLTTLVVIDEPVLGVDAPMSADAAGRLLRVVQAIRDNGGVAGIHTCATDVATSAAASRRASSDAARWPPDLWSVDLRGRNGRLPADISRTWATTGWLAAGLVPTVGALPLPLPTDLARTWVIAASACGDVSELVERTLVTASCGLAGVGVRGAEARFHLAAATAHHIRKRVSSTPDPASETP